MKSSRAVPISAYEAVADAKPMPYWLDSPLAPEVKPALVGHQRADLVVVGGGFTGLWTALIAKERDPGLDVVLIERETCPSGASGRNGGFMMGCYVDTFVLPNYPGQEQAMVDLGLRNRREIEETFDRYSIDCDHEPNGWIIVATKPWMVSKLKEIEKLCEGIGEKSVFWDRDQVQAAVHSPSYHAGVFQPDAIATVHPAKYAWGLKRVCEELGVRIFERTPATGLSETATGVRVDTPYGSVTAKNAALGTYAHPSLVRKLRWWRVPLYSHVLATEPLTDEQMASIGWAGRQGIIDLATFLNYYRLTKDNRIIWGHTDATVYRGRSVRSEFEQDFELFRRMTGDFFERFPQLEGIRFTHRWGGALETTSRTAPMFGSTHSGRVAYAHGYMPGVGGSHGGATTMLDLLAGAKTQYTEIPLVSGRGMHGSPSLWPFPPQPLLSLGVNLTRHALQRTDDTGKHSLMIKALTRVGFKF